MLDVEKVCSLVYLPKSYLSKIKTNNIENVLQNLNIILLSIPKHVKLIMGWFASKSKKYHIVLYKIR